MYLLVLHQPNKHRSGSVKKGDNHLPYGVQMVSILQVYTICMLAAVAENDVLFVNVPDFIILLSREFTYYNVPHSLDAYLSLATILQ